MSFGTFRLISFLLIFNIQQVLRTLQENSLARVDCDLSAYLSFCCNVYFVVKQIYVLYVCVLLQLREIE